MTTTFWQYIRNRFKLNPEPKPTRITFTWPKSIPLPGNYDADLEDAQIKESGLSDVRYIQFKLRITKALDPKDAPLGDMVDRVVYATVSSTTFRGSPGLYDALGVMWPPTNENLQKLVGGSYYIRVTRELKRASYIVATAHMIERNK
jgi:hypothetical protein